ncbi:MAG: hypothetical protein H0T46_02040 [Deltaproteobacteria bacterium]|nr:hypothetical protein [Deltaproteobacteria bacterium]
MSLRTILPLTAVFFLGCGGSEKTSNEPTTAKEKQRREAKASGEDDKGSRSWGGWRYKGDRNSCFFQVSGKCFKTENAACQAARCAKPKKCNVTGGGPALVSCK